MPCIILKFGLRAETNLWASSTGGVVVRGVEGRRHFLVYLKINFGNYNRPQWKR